MLDMRTLILNYLVSNALCAGVVVFLWLQNRQRFAGLGLWLIDFILQTIALGLIALRGIVPDWLSIIVSNVLVVGGTILLYIGLERFVGQRSTQVHNVGLLAIFTVSQAYFVFVQPSLAARNISMSVGLLAICAQCAWLMLRRVGAEMRPITKAIGAIFAVYCLVSAIRIVADIVIPPGNSLFRDSSTFDAFLLLASQMFLVLLTFSLFLMINRRLLTEQTVDIAKRQQIETALRQSEEKFSKAFHATPDAIVLSRLRDGCIIEVNEGFSRLSGYSQEEALNNPAIAVELWANLQDRERCISALRENHNVHDFEYDFRTKSGKILKCLYSGEIIDLGGEAHMLSVVRDITERKQAEVEIARLASFPQLNASPVLEVDASGAVTYCNPATQASLEKQGGPVDPRAFIPPDISEILQTLARGEATSFEREIELNDRIWSETIHLAPEFQSIRIYATDITARKQAEQVLRLRLQLLEFAANHSLEELMRRALDEIGKITGSPIGFYHFVEADQKTLLLQAWSTRTEKEFCKAEGKGLHYNIDQAGVWVDCVHQCKPVIHNDYAALPHRKGMPPGHAEVKRELVVPTMRDGQIVSILGVGNKPSDYGEQDIELVAYVADVIWSIVERKRMEEASRAQERALRESDERMRQITAAMRQAVWLRDTRTLEVLYVNPAYEEIWGRTCESLIAEPTSFAQAIHPDDKERVFAAIQDQYQGVFFDQEYRIIRPDGDIRWVWGRTFPIRNDSGEVYRVLAVAEDVTERKQMAEALHQAKETAETANRAKSAFLASMSHELRTPLTAILGFAELMSHDELLTAQQRENLEIIERSGEHLLALINNVLDLSKIEAGRTEVQPEIFDLHKMILGLGEMFNLRAEQKGLTIIFDLTPDVPRVIRADAGKLRQILINLLSNAVKFTEKGGITMRVERRVPIFESQIELYFKIQDTGIGIAAGELDRMFEAFVQTESGKQSHQGTGLGLSISREFARLMGGDLTVESEVGQGSCFQFNIRAQLPTRAEIDALIVAATSPHVVGMEPQRATPAGDAYRILVIDDAEANQELLRRLLQPLGFEIEAASDGQKGLEIWQAWQPHLIFLDIGLPEMDGHEVTKSIRAYATAEPTSDSAPHYVQPVIVALTASAFEEERQTILAEGCDDFVRKPFREATIFEILNRHLGIRFIYAEEPDAAVSLKKEIPFTVLKVQMRNSPVAWRTEMQQAILVGDVEKLNILIAQIHDHAPALAMYLAQCAYNFEYNKIQELIALE